MYADGDTYSQAVTVCRVSTAFSCTDIMVGASTVPVLLQAVQAIANSDAVRAPTGSMTPTASAATPMTADLQKHEGISDG